MLQLYHLDKAMIFAQAPSYQLIAHLAKKLRKKRAKAAVCLNLSLQSLHSWKNAESQRRYASAQDGDDGIF